MKKSILFFAILFTILYCKNSQAQSRLLSGRNSIWCFGDSAGIDFTVPSNPQPYFSAMRSRGTAVSICDTLGQLLFYAHTGDTSNNGTNTRGNILDKNHLLIDNGDSIIGISWYQEMVIIPMPGDTNKYYLFAQDVTLNYGIYYSIIDMGLNNGLGKVILKNQQILNIRMADCITAIKHGNGRDWWMYSRSGDGFLTSNPFYTYLISPSGILLDTLQNIGPLTGGGFIEFRWNKQGTKMAYVNYSGLIQVFDYDRCTGLISNPITLDTMRPSSPLPAYWACEFSASSRYLYVSASSTISYLYQYDLINLPTSFTRDTVWTTPFPVNTAGDLKRGPDDKIYLSSAYIDSMNNWNYPYPDSAYNIYNMNLSVINEPDSAFPACNFTPYSFYLGGKRTYWGLPNNPNYDMGVIAGSPCDTLSVGLSPGPSPEERGAIMQAWYNPAWNLIHVNASQLKGKVGIIRLLDVSGRTLYEKKIEFIHGGYYTTEIYMNAFSSGIYFMQLITDNEQVAGKVMKN
ncbi:MAG: T9SS type A sorting domain-containing protein [Bacteroidetes bacterium]|nr:T9SS type A sorting domain-containing protein [Bacteroidota bacterium]